LGWENDAMAWNAANAARIFLALAKRPRDVPRYVAHNGVTRQSPMQLGLPWMPYSVIDFLDRWIDSGTLVYEFGSGGSTLFFARRAGKVVSLENNERWANAVKQQVADDGLTNVDLRFVSADFSRPETVADSEFYRAIPVEHADMIVIDSIDHYTHGSRPVLFHRADELIRPGGLIVLDDAWRYRHLRGESNATEFRTFRGVGPGTRRAQWTDVFFY
jgi:predicted O-methyltransferase YrrM